LAITLADMNREHSLEVSIGMANNVINHMKKVTKMHKKTPQYKSLAVLKASDIPSMLVETGFISNHAEERRLLAGSHQQKLAKAIFTGVQSFFLDHPPMGSYYAKISYKKHKVARGDSLSVLAQRYKVSVNQLKSANNLASNKVVIGQTLKIPRAD
jgi:N-acetylmuramoyl-L-alanine amidase